VGAFWACCSCEAPRRGSEAGRAEGTAPGLPRPRRAKSSDAADSTITRWECQENGLLPFLLPNSVARAGTISEEERADGVQSRLGSLTGSRNRKGRPCVAAFSFQRMAAFRVALCWQLSSCGGSGRHHRTEAVPGTRARAAVESGTGRGGARRYDAQG